MKSSLIKYFSTLFFVLFVSGCSTAIKPNQIEGKDKKSIDFVLPRNLILKTPIIDIKQLKYDVFLDVLKKLNNVNHYNDNLCEITTTDIKDWNDINAIAKKNISLLSYNNKDFKVLRAVCDETLPSAYYAFSKPEKDLSTPFIYLEVEYIDKSIGIINAVYKKDKIYYLIYSETLQKNKNEQTSHSLFTKIFYFPSGNVKSYTTKSSFYNFNIGMNCEYKEDGTIIKEENIEKLFNSNLTDIADVVYDLYGYEKSNKNKPSLLSDWNQYWYNYNKIDYHRFFDTNYGKVWRIKTKKDTLLIDDISKNIIEENNFIELSDKEYFQKYGNKNFKELEKELKTKILIIKDIE